MKHTHSVRIGTRQRDASCDKQAEHSEEDNAQVRHRGEARKGTTQKGKEVYTSDCMLLVLTLHITYPSKIWKSRMVALWVGLFILAGDVHAFLSSARTARK